jgi:hypothetical protein
MFWSEVVGCMLEVVPSLLEFAVATYEFMPGSPPPSPRTDSDDWKCPRGRPRSRGLSESP